MTSDRVKIYSLLVISWLLSLATWRQLSLTLQQFNRRSIIWSVLLISVMTAFVAWFFILTKKVKLRIILISLISLGFLAFFSFNIGVITGALLIFLALFLFSRSLNSNLKFDSAFSMKRSIYPSLNTFLIILSLVISWQVYLQIANDPLSITKDIQLFLNNQIQQTSKYLFSNVFKTPETEQSVSSPSNLLFERDLSEFFSPEELEKFNETQADNPDLLTGSESLGDNFSAENYQNFVLPLPTLESFVDNLTLSLYLPFVIAILIFFSLLSFKFFWRLIIIICAWLLFEILKLLKIIKSEKVVYEARVWKWS